MGIKTSYFLSVGHRKMKQYQTIILPVQKYLQKHKYNFQQL